jgi:hypothetical protein
MDEPGDRFVELYTRIEGVSDTTSSKYREWMMVCEELLTSVGLPAPKNGFTKRAIREAIKSGRLDEDHAIAVLMLVTADVRTHN